MRTQERKLSWRNIVESKPVLVLLGIGIIIFAWSVSRFWGKMEETGRNKEIAEEKLEALVLKKEKLLKDIENLNTAEGKEEFIRENYGLAKEGEQMIIIVEDKKVQIEPKKSSFSSFLSVFKNWFK